MVRFKVNGREVEAPQNMNVLDYLRDTLRLTSVKNGCKEGACGTCMVLVDGKTARICVRETDRMAGKHIETVEGFTPFEKEVYAEAFARVGAVQCGFCIPGMLISAKALLNVYPLPTPSDVKKAIRYNICRCTGYARIEEAILLAAKWLRDGVIEKADCDNPSLGQSLRRVDAIEKALGEAKYADDILLPGMLYGSAVRVTCARGRLTSLDVSKAKEVEGVVCVLTAKDIEGHKKIGHIVQDWDVLIEEGNLVHTIGDAVALVAATSKAALREAKAAVIATYEVLPPITSPEEALKDGAPRVHDERDNCLKHEILSLGDADAALSASAHVVTHKYSTPFTEHAFLEPECAVALPAALDPEADGTYDLRIFSGDQGIYQTQHECADTLGIAHSRVRVTAMMVGGGFGGKEDMSVQHHAALLAMKTGAPVKVTLSREESIRIHPKRHAMEMEFTTGCDKNGILTAMKATIVADTGAYASLGGPVLQRACTHAAGPYNYSNIYIDGKAVYTNNPPAGAFRGFGVTQSCFATECNINELARKVGISPYEMRLRNAIRPGQVLPNGQIADETTRLYETLLAVEDIMKERPEAGIACAMKNSGLGVGIPDTGRARLDVENGKVVLRSSAACIGQGMGTVQLQMAAEATGLSADRFIYAAPDTHKAPDSGNTTASRQTVFTGEATIRAAEKLKVALDEVGGHLCELNGQSFLGEYSSETDKMNCGKKNPVSHVAYGYATQVVLLDESGNVERVIAAHDVGKAVNPIALKGQIEGGVVMSLGYALTEDFPLKDGVPTAKYGKLGLLRSTDVPPIESIIIGIHEGEEAQANSKGRALAYGAKGVGEICSIPTPPAVQLAYFNRDGVFRTKLPMKMK